MAKKAAFIIKPPSAKEKRRSFQFTRRIPDTISPGKFRYEKVKDSRIDALNAVYSKDPSDFNSCLKQAEALRDTFYKEEAARNREGIVVFHGDNANQLKKFWKAYLATRRPHIDPRTARDEYRRAIEALGNLPLLTARVEGSI